VYEAFSNDWFLRQLAKLPGAGSIITKALFAITGEANVSNLNASNWEVLARYDPGGIGTYDLIHWMQMARQQLRNASEFIWRMHDWGPTLNEEYYGSPTPPAYNISGGQTHGPHTWIFWGEEDFLTMAPDVAALARAVNQSVFTPANTSTPRPVLEGVVGVAGYGHLSFTMGLDAHTRLFPQVVAILERHRTP